MHILQHCRMHACIGFLAILLMAHRPMEDSLFQSPIRAGTDESNEREDETALAEEEEMNNLHRYPSIDSNPLLFPMQHIDISSKKLTKHTLAWALSGSYQLNPTAPHLPFSVRSAGAGLTWYPGQLMFQGLFIEPKVGFARYIEHLEGTTLATPNVSGTIGYSWRLGDALRIHVGAGMQYLLLQQPQVQPERFWVQNVLPLGQFSFGYSF